MSTPQSTTSGQAEESFHGLPSLLLQLPSGDSLRVLRHGAHVVSWVAGGQERLYLSPKSVLDGQAAIRGGVPVCFPQFNMRGPLPKHGFVRNLPWEVDGAARMLGDGLSLTLQLRDGAATRAYWPQAFEARFTLLLRPGELQLTLDLRNTDTQPLSFSGALHTYFAVNDIAQTRLEGLGGQAEWDSVRDVHGQGAEPLRFTEEFDRVYQAAAQPLTLQDSAARLTIAQSASWGHTVVWNPGAGKVIPDLTDDAYRHFLCVEAAQVLTPVTVPPGGTWQGWQRSTLAR
ncbi:D-hexose-6-phosphate mutarotase [Hylemonella sp. W303a]|uniref:D-hexose-6-phosphate mutarotase n=1 Tax=Hylemonella sp. W303a TaxID=3389873 RepID=UPI00396AFEF5